MKTLFTLHLLFGAVLTISSVWIVYEVITYMTDKDPINITPIVLMGGAFGGVIANMLFFIRKRF